MLVGLREEQTENKRNVCAPRDNVKWTHAVRGEEDSCGGERSEEENVSSSGVHNGMNIGGIPSVSMRRFE